jgi:hypothetical protein
MTPERALQRAGHNYPGQITANLRDAGFVIIDKDQLQAYVDEQIAEFINEIYQKDPDLVLRITETVGRSTTMIVDIN